MNWFDLVPNDVARLQLAYERRHRVLRVRQAGLTYRELGAALGVSFERARQIVLRAQRDKLSPVERYCVAHGDICELAEKLSTR
jgi:hypothetical protein